MNAPFISPYERERQTRRDAAMTVLACAKRRADHDDFETWGEGTDEEVTLQTYVLVAWDTEEHSNGGTYRVAYAAVIGARFGNILLDRDTLDCAFPGQVDRLEDRLSEQYTKEGEA